jgi:hypothetical protein
LNQAPNNLIQPLAASPLRWAATWQFSSKIIALAPSLNLRAKSQQGLASVGLLRAQVSDTVSITTKTNLQNKSALATVIVGYAALWLAILAFKVDFRFWIIAIKLMGAKQFLIFLIHLVPFTAFFVIALHVLNRNFSTMGAGRGALYLTNIFALTLGFIVLLGLQYGTL